MHRVEKCAAFLLAAMVWGSEAQAAPFAYVPGSNSTSVTVIDTATDTVADTINVGDNFLQSAVVSPDGLRAYTASISTGRIHVIDTVTNTVLTSVFVSNFGVYSLALNPAGTRLYATAANSLAVMDTATNTLLAPIIGTFDNPQNVAVTPNGTRAYVTNAFSGIITVVDLVGNAVLTTIPTFGSNRGVDISPDGTRAYVTEDTFGLYVIDTATNTTVTTVSTPSTAIAVIVHPDGSKAYVATGTGLTVVDTATNMVITSVPLGGNNFGVAITPSGDKVYVASFFNDAAVVFDTATNTVLGSVPVADEPFARGEFVGPDFVCGDGFRQPGEECDDGNVVGGDGCSASCTLDCGNAATLPKIVVAKVDAPAGDEKLLVTGKVVLPNAMPALNPLVTGIRLQVKRADGVLTDTTLPGGAYVAPGPGWKVNAAGTTWKYLDKTAPASGIFAAVIVNKSAQVPGLVKFTVKGKNADYLTTAPQLPLSAIVQLDPTAAGANCAGIAFAPMTDCGFNASGKTLKCK